MSDIIEFACDICGHKHRYSEEKMGRTADCRECGAPFELSRHTIAREEDADEDDEDEVSTWVILRGTLIGAAIVFILGWLAFLPFYKPDPDRATAAGGPRPSNWPASNPAFPGSGPSARPSSNVPPRPPSFEALLKNEPVGTEPVKNEPAWNAPGDRVAANAPEKQGQNPPEKPDPAEPDAPAEASSADFKNCPHIARITIESGEGRRFITIHGSNLSKVEQVIPFYIPHYPMKAEPFTVISDSEIRITPTLLPGGKSVGAVVMSNQGSAVTVPADAVRVNKDEKVDIRTAVEKVIIVEKDGVAAIPAMPIVFVERGGVARITHPFGFFVVDSGGTLESRSRPQVLVLCSGGTVNVARGTPKAPERTPRIRFCPVAKLGDVK